MSRLRNRMTKAEFWTDPELLAWPRDKRWFYHGLRALAEDSGCLEDSPFGWMCVLYCSPLDRDITIEDVTRWRDELVAAGKLVPYEVAGKRYVYQPTFHDHEHPRNPQPPSLPLPPWIRWLPNPSDSRKGRYDVDISALDALRSGSTSVVQPLYNELTTVPAQPSPAQPSPVLKPIGGLTPAGGRAAEDFEEWWATYGRVGSKTDAERLYRFWTAKGAERGDLLKAAQVYRAHCARTDTKMKHASTFLAKPPKGSRARWYEWAAGEEHGAMDVRDEDELADVLAAGSRTFHLGDRDDRSVAGQAHPRVGPHARRGLPEVGLADEE